MPHACLQTSHRHTEPQADTLLQADSQLGAVLKLFALFLNSQTVMLMAEMAMPGAVSCLLHHNCLRSQP